MNASSKSTWISKVKVDFAATRCGCRDQTSPAPLHAQLGWLHFQALVYTFQPAIGLCM